MTIDGQWVLDMTCPRCGSKLLSLKLEANKQKDIQVEFLCPSCNPGLKLYDEVLRRGQFCTIGGEI